MKAQHNPAPKQNSQKGDGGNRNEPDKGQTGTSRPKDPDNDPDQTPEREVKNPPKADPARQNPARPRGKEPYK